MSIDVDRGFHTKESRIIDKIIAMRARYNKVVVGKRLGDAYEIISKEFFCSPISAAGMVNLNGYYRCFRSQVEEIEKRERSKIPLISSTT